MHNLAKSFSARNSAIALPKLVVETAPTFRRAQLLDVLQICALVNRYAADKLMLPRTTEQVVLELDNYVVTSDTDGRVLACAAIYEYSPSVAEIASVAVDEAMVGNRLGTQAVLHEITCRTLTRSSCAGRVRGSRVGGPNVCVQLQANQIRRAKRATEK